MNEILLTSALVNALVKFNLDRTAYATEDNVYALAMDCFMEAAELYAKANNLSMELDDEDRYWYDDVRTDIVADLCNFLKELNRAGDHKFAFCRIVWIDTHDTEDTLIALRSMKELGYTETSQEDGYITYYYDCAESFVKDMLIKSEEDFKILFVYSYVDKIGEVF